MQRCRYNLIPAPRLSRCGSPRQIWCSSSTSNSRRSRNNSSYSTLATSLYVFYCDMNILSHFKSSFDRPAASASSFVCSDSTHPDRIPTQKRKKKGRKRPSSLQVIRLSKTEQLRFLHAKYRFQLSGNLLSRLIAIDKGRDRGEGQEQGRERESFGESCGEPSQSSTTATLRREPWLLYGQGRRICSVWEFHRRVIIWQAAPKAIPDFDRALITAGMGFSSHILE